MASHARSQILTILEGRWFPDIDVSVRALFVPLFTVWSPQGEAASHYETFTNAAAFRDAVVHAFRRGGAKTIYIAAHGDKHGIQGFHDTGISRTKIKHALTSVPASGTRCGVFFGACEFATRANARFILGPCDRVEWLAGYTTYVDWIDSSVLDLFFLRHYLFPEPGRGHGKPETPMARVSYATDRVCTYMHDLARETQFHVWVRKRDGVRDLVEEALGGKRLSKSSRRAKPRRAQPDVLGSLANRVTLRGKGVTGAY